MTKSLAQASEEATMIVSAAAATAAGVGWLPGSSLLLGGVDVLTINKVADAFGVEDYTIEQVVATVGKSFVGKRVATELLSFFPGLGWAIKSGVAGATTAAAADILLPRVEKLRDRLGSDFSGRQKASITRGALGDRAGAIGAELFAERFQNIVSCP